MSREEFQRYIAKHPPGNTDNTATYEGFLVYMSKRIPDTSCSTKRPNTILLEKIDKQQQTQSGSIESNSLSQSMETPTSKECTHGATSPPLHEELVREIDRLNQELKEKSALVDELANLLLNEKDARIEQMEKQISEQRKNFEDQNKLIEDYKILVAFMRSKFPDP